MNQVEFVEGIFDIVHEIGHGFDFNGEINKSDTFTKFLSPDSNCIAARLGCLNPLGDKYSRNVNRWYSLGNMLLAHAPMGNFGYSPLPGSTTSYGMTSSIEDFAETYAIVTIQSAGLTQNLDVSKERKIILQTWIDLAKTN